MNMDNLKKYLATGEEPAVAQDEAIEQHLAARAEEAQTAQDEALERYLAAVAEDAEPELTDLQKHDKRFHPNGYKEGDKCSHREALKKGDDSDKIAKGDDPLKEAKSLGYLGDPEHAAEWLTWPIAKGRREERERLLRLAGGDEEKADDLLARVVNLKNSYGYASAKGKRDALVAELGESPDAQAVIKSIDDAWERSRRELNEYYATRTFTGD